MNRFRPVILGLSVLVAAFLAYGLFTMPSPEGVDEEGFSSARVLKDIDAISKEHHSVAHPEERAQVCDYLVNRLRESGADTVKIFSYDSLVGPKNRHVEYTFDAHNILAEFSPANDTSGQATQLMLIAHYDSRYSHLFARDTVWSYGAADDGYGVGVILETVSQLIKERDEWKQGVKVLFTDAEEVGMMGMSAMWENDRNEFDNVGLVVNVEARGTWGPALLFETCPGSEKVMDLYASAASYPYTYSLSTLVYRFLPNFTDYTIIKDSIPGVNFSTVADINHYHTHLDNFSNVSEKSIQHYGSQILPLAREYVLNGDYSDVNAMKADSDPVSFTIPVLGLLNFSKVGYVIVNVVLFVLFLLLFGLEAIRGRLNVGKVLVKAGVLLGASAGVLAVGTLVSVICSSIAGVPFKLFGTIQGVMFDNVMFVVSTVVMVALSVLVYVLVRSAAMRKSLNSMRQSAPINAARNHAYIVMYATLVIAFVASLSLLIFFGENMMFLIPLAFTTIAMVLYHLTNLRAWLLIGIVLMLLHALSFYFVLSMTLTIGALGIVMMLSFFVVMLIVSMADLYMMPSKKK